MLFLSLVFVYIVKGAENKIISEFPLLRRMRRYSMKKIILTLSGVLFVIVTGCSLLICMMNGIPNLDQPAAAFYLAKAILLSFSLPLVTLGLFVHCLQLRRKLDKKNLLFRNVLGDHFPEGNPNDYYCTCFSANLRAISIHAEVFLKRNYGGCCKRLTLIIPGIRSLWQMPGICVLQTKKVCCI